MKFSSKFAPLFAALFALILIQSCDEDDRFSLNFDDAPPPFDTSQAVRDSTLPGNIQIFVIEEGDGPFNVVPRDVIMVRYTGRDESGQIFESSFSNLNVRTTRSFTNLTPNPTVGPGGTRPPLVEGFRKGLLGMREGESRTIVVPPDMGFTDDRPRNRNGFDLRGQTLTYDVELVNIQQQ